jgi:hypothetical protein
MSFEYSELGSDDNHSNDDLEKVGFLSEVKCRSSRFDFFRGLWSLKTFATVLPWLLVIGLILALTNRPETLVPGCAEFELDRYCMHASTFAHPLIECHISTGYILVGLTNCSTCI